MAKQLQAHLTVLHVIDNIEIPTCLILGNDRILIERARRSMSSMENGWNKMVKDIIDKLKVDKNIISTDSKCVNGILQKKF